MRILLILILVVLSALLASPLMAGGDADSVAQRGSSWFTGQEQQAGQSGTSSPLYRTTLTPTFFVPPTGPTRLRDLTPETERPRTQGILASTTWLKGSFITETEVANNQGGSGWLDSKVPGYARDDAAGRMMRIGLTGVNGSVRYGMTYRIAGQTFYNGGDQAVREMWGEWKSGLTTIRSSVGQQWNNVAGDMTRSRFEQTYERVALMWNKPAWPNLSLTYSRTSLASALDPVGVAPQRTANHLLEAAVVYNTARWNARLASSYIVGSDLLRNGAESRVNLQIVTASFRPINTLTISPTFAYRAEQQDWSGVRIDSPSFSLSMQYKQSRRLLITAMGNYTGTRSSDGLIDAGTVGGMGSLAWDVQEFHHWTTMISLEAGYNRLTNRAAPSTDTEDLSGLLRLVVASL
ncbi:MAG TPA: hypothetical protein VFS39_16980 [Nitrospira sp.]|nr:hypothetical protein [Nitrospira sp.]